MSDGLAIVVGSGLSCAEGLPGMSALASQLAAEVPAKISGGDFAAWNTLEPLIRSKGLEPALFAFAPSDTLEATITSVVGDFIAAEEKKVLSEVLVGSRVLRLTRLIPHLLKPEAGIHFMTTNYDHLIEVAVEEAGLGVDTMFVGTFSGQLNETEARWSFCRGKDVHGKLVRLRFKSRAVVSKPHGSLDWYLRDGVPVRFAGDVSSLQRLIITPGRQKFRSGYDSPFDRQRERANRAIEAASRFIIIGYGFNDDHLETYLTPAIKGGKPSLMITRNLLPNAEALALAHKNVISLDQNTARTGTRLIVDATSIDLPGLDWWDLEEFVKGVLEP